MIHLDYSEGLEMILRSQAKVALSDKLKRLLESRRWAKTEPPLLPTQLLFRLEHIGGSN